MGRAFFYVAAIRVQRRPEGGNWLLARLVAQGREVLIANDHRIEVLGANTCKNIELPFVDLCASFAEGIDMVKSNPLSEKLGTLSGWPVFQTAFKSRVLQRGTRCRLP